MNVNVVESGVAVLVDLLDMPRRIGPADDLVRDRLFRHEAGRLLEQRGGRQLGHEAPREARKRPYGARDGFGRVFAFRPADLHLPVGRLARAPRDTEGLHHVRLRGHADQAVGDPSRQVGGLLPGGGEENGRRPSRTAEDPGGFHRKIFSPVAPAAAPPEEPQDLDRLAEHLPAHLDGRPVPPQNMLVQIFPGAEAEKKTVRHHEGARGRGLGDDRRVGAQGGTGDAGPERQAPRRLGNAADHAPDERAVPLAPDPRMDVIGDEREGEPAVLGDAREAHEIGRRVFFARQRVARLHYGALPSAASAPPRWLKKPSNFRSGVVTRRSGILLRSISLKAFSTGMLGRTVVGPGSITSSTLIDGCACREARVQSPRTTPSSSRTGQTSMPISYAVFCLKKKTSVY